MSVAASSQLDTTLGDLSGPPGLSSPTNLASESSEALGRPPDKNKIPDKNVPMKIPVPAAPPGVLGFRNYTEDAVPSLGKGDPSRANPGSPAMSPEAWLGGPWPTNGYPMGPPPEQDYSWPGQQRPLWYHGAGGELYTEEQVAREFARLEESAAQGWAHAQYAAQAASLSSWQASYAFQQAMHMQALMGLPGESPGVELNNDEEALPASVYGQVRKLVKTEAGSRMVQIQLETASEEDKRKIVNELRGHVRESAKCPHANHVIQKMLANLSVEDAEPIINELLSEGEDSLLKLVRHKFGCRICQRIIENIKSPLAEDIVNQLLRNAVPLSQHTYANFVIQSIIKDGSDSQKERIMQTMIDHCFDVGGECCGAGVLGKALEDPRYKQQLSGKLLGNPPALAAMGITRHGHSTVKLALEAATDTDRERALIALEGEAAELQKSRYGRVLKRYLQEHPSNPNPPPPPPPPPQDTPPPPPPTPAELEAAAEAARINAAAALDPPPPTPAPPQTTAELEAAAEAARINAAAALEAANKLAEKAAARKMADEKGYDDLTPATTATSEEGEARKMADEKGYDDLTPATTATSEVGEVTSH